MTPELFGADNLENVRGVLLDLDGTVYEGDRLVAGAGETVDALRSRMPVRFVTNTTRMSRPHLVEKMRGMGLVLAPDDLLTAPVAAARWLADREIRSIALYLPEATHADFVDFNLEAETPEAVIVGDLGPGWTFDVMNRIFRQLLDGAQLVALQRNRYWKKPEGLVLDAGPFVAALEYAADVKATIVGKPSGAFFEAAASLLKLPLESIVMVGDDIESDVGGFQDRGGRGVLVKTGKFRAANLESSSVQPDMVIESIADLPGALMR